MHDNIRKFIDTYESSYDKLNGVLVFKNTKVYDTDFASINFIDNIFYFEFNDDRFEDFKVNVGSIKDITFDSMDDIQCVYLELINGDKISVFCM